MGAKLFQIKTSLARAVFTAKFNEERGNHVNHYSYLNILTYVKLLSRPLNREEQTDLAIVSI